mmetsp:Transcript_81667/g.218523  ORF Transcript_81667/g.218523 Transcript_81667/m.218523 type:complete len:229 (-) Transcript_81667:62-748(-)
MRDGRLALLQPARVEPCQVNSVEPVQPAALRTSEDWTGLRMLFLLTHTPHSWRAAEATEDPADQGGNPSSFHGIACVLGDCNLILRVENLVAHVVAAVVLGCYGPDVGLPARNLLSNNKQRDSRLRFTAKTVVAQRFILSGSVLATLIGEDVGIVVIAMIPITILFLTVGMDDVFNDARLRQHAEIYSRIQIFRRVTVVVTLDEQNDPRCDGRESDQGDDSQAARIRQ